MQASRMMYSNDCPNLNEPQSTQFGITDCAKPVIIGLYGIPGSGKTFWLDKLKTALGNDNFAFYDGSDIIAAVTPGGLKAFQNLTEEAKNNCREFAIARIKQECCNTGKSAIVAGHLMFWAEEDQAGQSVCTPGDLATYTHILYLDVPAEIIAVYRFHDGKRSRPSTSISHLARWQAFEISELRHLCRHHNILFTLVSPPLASVSKLVCIIRDFRTHSEGYNKNVAEQRMDEILADSDRLETVIVLDADKTLAQEDSGVLFWEQVRTASTEDDSNSPLKALFSSPLGYSYTAFRQATLLYEEALGDVEFEACCETVSSLIHMHSDIKDLLHLVRRTTHVHAIVITCGIRSVWEKVLEREGLSLTVKVIGGGRLRDGLVVTPSVKAELVRYLSTVRQLYVFAFGDSPLDLEMLKAANEAIVVTGEETTRSKSMEKRLAEAVGKNGFQPRQAVLPQHATPRLDTPRLPSVRLTDRHFIDSVLARYKRPYVLHATDRPAAKLLMTPMRDASISGPALREVHRRVGYYLGAEFCTEIIGIECYPIPHVQGYQSDGYRLLNEKETLIVPLMRGGEAMAFGVNDAFPLCTFHHAKIPNDLHQDNLKNIATIILVDSVVNTGKSVLEFVQHIRSLHATIRIVVVAGVIHSPAISTSRIAWSLGRFTGLYFVALRFSNNQFTGRGITDTGNRLFRTVHMD
ncbi:hypothetical protein N7449_009648 [Penicillium cf. viridicatum]|uniref:Phosphoribosyltransferase domain-containing protein n=1 Tax=Penicillium cf. viridicatum TaxID=2972119 RepID=A0A9W9JCL6_9EURO|nr:hypothetical protein N7449_009648 [Penicillium cf. viridicatum]